MALAGKALARPVVVPEDLRNHAVYAAALDVVSRLVACGYRTLFVGGFVRGLALRLFAADTHPQYTKPAVSFDIDIATEADPAQIRAVFRNAHFVGQIFGVSMVDSGSHAFEVATFRSEGRYSDGRRPDAVTKGTLDADAARRDFTVNALYFDPLTSEILDFHRGIDDVQSRTIRTVGDAERRFGEDRLRVIRMCRFAALLDFAVEDATWRSALAMAGGVNLLSQERILIEIKKTPPRGVPRFLALLQMLKLDELLWGLSFDGVPIWFDRSTVMKDLEILLAREAHHPVSFVLVASWKHFLGQDAGTRVCLAASLMGWPTTVQDRRLVQGLGQLANLLDQAMPNATTLAVLSVASRIVWLTALQQVLAKLEPLGPECLKALCAAGAEVGGRAVADGRARSFVAHVTPLVTGALASLGNAAAADSRVTEHCSTLSRRAVVAAVQSGNHDPRWIGVVDTWIRLRHGSNGCLPDDVLRGLDEGIAALLERGQPDGALLAEIKSLMNGIR